MYHHYCLVLGADDCVVCRGGNGWGVEGRGGEGRVGMGKGWWDAVGEAGCEGRGGEGGAGCGGRGGR